MMSDYELGNMGMDQAEKAMEEEADLYRRVDTLKFKLKAVKEERDNLREALEKIVHLPETDEEAVKLDCLFDSASEIAKEALAPAPNVGGKT